jgi:hypothetical protein
METKAITLATISAGEPAKRRRGGKRRPKRLLSTAAQKTAAVVLEVLAGSLGVKEAAQGLGISEMSYYHTEDRALKGLASACEPAVKGPGQDPDKALADLRKENTRLERALKRYQALTRATQRAAGLMIPRPPEPKPDKNGKHRKPRRPMARALRAAARFKAGADQAPAAANTVSQPAISAGGQ